MKAVLISIQPKWCELIASGKKTIEVRKTRPKIDLPFKVYIYCTKDEPLYHSGEKFYMKKANEFGNGKVLGEFVCDKITEFEGEFWDDETQEIVKEVVHKTDWDGYPETEMRCVAENGKKNYLCDRSCLTWEDLRSYIGQGDSTFYGWHISDLVIYDKPKELNEFYVRCSGTGKKEDTRCATCPHLTWGYGSTEGYTEWCTTKQRKSLTRPPQSWCYVEE